MNRQLTYLAGPETALLLASLAVFWFCSRHNSGEGRDATLLSRTVWMIPFILAPIAFSTFLVPGARTWAWLARAVVVSYIAILICAFRVVEGFGSGSKGQDVAIILTLMLASVAVAIPTTIVSALLLADARPALGAWFHNHRILGSLLIAASAIPIGAILAMTATVAFALVLGIYAETTRR